MALSQFGEMVDDFAIPDGCTVSTDFNDTRDLRVCGNKHSGCAFPVQTLIDLQNKFPLIEG